MFLTIVILDVIKKLGIYDDFVPSLKNLKMKTIIDSNYC